MSEVDQIAEELEPIRRLTRDLRTAARVLSPMEARYLVDSYYQMQRNRIRAGNQVRALTESNEPHEMIDWVQGNSEILERNIKSALNAYSQGHPVGKWAQSIVGIGPVISAGLLAHIDMNPWRCHLNKNDPTQKACTEKEPHDNPGCRRERLATAGKIWRFAGLDPTVKWNEGQKRPWNAALKRLCWIIGESFTKVSSNERDFYGKLYLQRKVQEESKNAAGEFAQLAKESLSSKRWVRETQTRAAYEKGLLPQARIHLRAQRFAVKIFLAHWQTVAYYNAYKEMPPKPYAIAILGHTDEIQVPNWPFKS